MKKLIFENIGLKIAAVLLAVILWFFVTSKGQSEISMDIPLELKNIPKGLESVGQSAKTVSVSIKGQERLLKNMKPSAVRIYIDLSKAKKGKGTYYFNKDDVKLPSTMTVINISPSSAWIVLEETIIKIVPVQPVIIGSPPKGFTISSVEYSPKSVAIEGVRSEVRGIKVLKTDPVDVTDMSKTAAQDVRLDTDGKNIKTEIQEVKVKVTIKGGKNK